MWSKEYADDDEINPEGEDYLGQKEQVPFTLHEEGANTYEAGYMSTEPAQQQRVEMGIVKPLALPQFQKQTAPPKQISTPAAQHAE